MGDHKAFDAEALAAMLPHRFPFRFVDRVLSFEDSVRLSAIKNVSSNEPYFPGHFPDRPIMPGVLICEALAQAGGLLVLGSRGVPAGRAVVLSGLDAVRFRRLVVPGDQLVLEVELRRRHGRLWKLYGVARVTDEVVAEAELLLMEVEVEAP